MDLFDEELLKLFTAFHKNEFRYLLVGGFAINHHGYQRTTGDVDIWMEDTLVNRKALRKSLAYLGYGDIAELETVPLIAGWTTIVIDSGINLDLMSDIKGFTSEKFEECYEMSSIQLLDEVPIRFLHYNHLIEAKKAAGRPKDILDIRELERLKDIKDRSEDL